MALKIEKKVKLLLRKGKKVFNIFSSFYTFVAFVGAVGLLPFALVLYLGKFNRVRFLVIVKLLKDIIVPLLSMMFGLCSQTHLTVANYSRHNLSFFFSSTSFTFISVTTICRYFWHASLRRKYPELDFVTTVTLRTAMDTIRNQGIVTVMLQVKGAHHYETVKQQVLVSETLTK